jgi:hypothetical protein
MFSKLYNFKQSHWTYMHTYESYELIIPKKTNPTTKTWEMHIKINKQKMDPNFLTHDLWSKTKQGNQQIHQGML